MVQRRRGWNTESGIVVRDGAGPPRVRAGIAGGGPRSPAPPLRKGVGDSRKREVFVSDYCTPRPQCGNDLLPPPKGNIIWLRAPARSRKVVLALRTPEPRTYHMAGLQLASTRARKRGQARSFPAGFQRTQRESDGIPRKLSLKLCLLNPDPVPVLFEASSDSMGLPSLL